MVHVHKYIHNNYDRVILQSLQYKGWPHLEAGRKGPGRKFRLGRLFEEKQYFNYIIIYRTITEE